MFLTWFAVSDIILAVCFYSRPEISGSKDSGSHGVCAGMIATNAFVQLFNNILCLFCCDTLEKGLAVSAFEGKVKGFFNEDVVGAF